MATLTKTSLGQILTTSGKLDPSQLRDALEFQTENGGYLGKAICISNTINCLELENCEIGDDGCLYLRRGMERNQTIR